MSEMAKIYEIQASDGRIYEIQLPDENDGQQLKNLNNSEEFHSNLKTGLKRGIEDIKDVYQKTARSGPSFLTISGGPASEFGHQLKTKIFKNVGMPDLVAESLSSATDPQNMFLQAASLKPVATGYMKSISQKSKDLSKKAMDTTAYILPTEKGRLSDSMRRGYNLPEIEETSKVITPTKDYEELGKKLQSSIKEPISKRSDVYNSLTSPTDRSQLDKALKLLKEQRTSAQGRIPARQIDEIITNEVDFLNKQNPEVFKDPNFYQLRKMEYQKLADDLGAYAHDPKFKPKAYAYKKIAEGYKDKLNSLDPEIQKQTRRIEGLSISEKKAFDLAEKQKLTPPQKFSEEVIKGLRGGPQSTIAAVFRGISDKIPVVRDLAGRTLEGETTKIYNLMKKSKKIDDTLKILEKIYGGL